MITLFQHGKDEPAGEIAAYLTERQIPHSTIRLYENGVVPADLPDGLILLGGEMSVNDTREYPFLEDEKQVIRRMVEAGRPVLGICLGAQLIASAFGGRVFRDTREQGWVAIRGCGFASGGPFSGTFRVFHWHNETFALPEGAELLATGGVIRNQAFRIQTAAGVQYHPEVTLPIIARWAGSCRTEERERILQESEQYLPADTAHCHCLVDHFLGGWNA